MGHDFGHTGWVGHTDGVPLLGHTTGVGHAGGVELFEHTGQALGVGHAGHSSGRVMPHPRARTSNSSVQTRQLSRFSLIYVLTAEFAQLKVEMEQQESHAVVVVPPEPNPSGELCAFVCGADIPTNSMAIQRRTWWRVRESIGFIPT
jgi:hypothetical protein